jgi:hypothetical protein
MRLVTGAPSVSASTFAAFWRFSNSACSSRIMSEGMPVSAPIFSARAAPSGLTVTLS